MQITFDLETALHCLLVIALVVLVVILCIVAVKLVNTLKSMNSILKDMKVVSSTVADKTKDVDKMISSASETVGNLAETLKGNQNLVKAVTVLVNSFATIKGMIVKANKEEKK